MDKIFPLVMDPGVQRDGTKFSKRNWSDSQWVRFYDGLPQKMLGYKEVQGAEPPIPEPPDPPIDKLWITDVPRGLYVIPQQGSYIIYVGTYQKLYSFSIDFDGEPLSPIVDRTPASFVVNINNQWSFDVIYSNELGISTLLAIATPNLNAIDSAISGTVYRADVSSTTGPLIPTTVSVDGGIVALQPYLFSFGSSGFIEWSQPLFPETVMGSGRVAPYKIIAGLPTRGGNSSPAGLFWSLERLIRCTFIGGGGAPFIFDTVTSQSSCLSSSGMIEADGVFFWCGTERFLSYGGQVTELPNSMSLQYFFDNLNYIHRQKIWVTKITKWGEIWWHFPKGESTECNHAVIYNVRERTWYDTAINRSCGYYDQTFAQPVWASNTSLPIPGGAPGEVYYPIYLQEEGYDQQNFDGTLTAIPAYITTGDVSYISQAADKQRPETDVWTYLYRVEPDFVRIGEMSLVVSGSNYATVTAPGTQNGEVVSSPYLFDPDTVKIDMREQRRIMNLTFSSNVVGGYFQMGKILVVTRTGDQRQ